MMIGKSWMYICAVA